MKMKRNIRHDEGWSPLGHLANEEGMMLVLTMVIFLVISSIAATNIINAYLERSLARNQHYATIGLNAADGGIDHGLGWLNANAPPDHTVTPGWVEDDPDLNGNDDVDGGWDLNGDGNRDTLYNVTLRFKLDEDDLDQDGDITDIVLYNRCVPDGTPATDDCFGYPESVFDDPTDPAYPVVEIRSEGAYVGDEITGVAKTPSRGGGRRVVTLDVARNGFEVKAYGAVTASSNVNVTGNINVDGNAHDDSGTRCDAGGSCVCPDAYPGVTVDDDYAVTQGGSADNDGDPAATSEISDLATFLGEPIAVPTSPDDALGLPEGTLIASLPGGTINPGEIKDWGTVRYVAGDYTWNLNDTETGILIVHNPNFTQDIRRKWAVSDCETGAEGPDCDPADPADYDPRLDPDDAQYNAGGFADDNAPAVLDQHGNGTWKGAVIADKVDKINGNCNVIGAMISLTTIETNILGNGAANVLYSCDAINLYTTQGYGTKISWHRRF